jgi:predicted AAA+ superfamily ATPase
MVQPRLEPRLYSAMLRQHFSELRQMALLAGPRQVGKTTLCRTLDADARYLTWDDQDDRRLLLRGPKAVAEHLELAALRAERPLVVFDELHKHRKWKQFLKGFYDGFADRVRIAVTGSSRLDVYRRGGDSLMGRYFLYRVHPLSVGELLHQEVLQLPLRPPELLPPRRFDQLLQRGGFPEPFQKDARFGMRWRELRRQQLVREDVRDLTRVQELGQMQVLEQLLRERSGCSLTFRELANTVQVTSETCTRWVDILVQLQHGFLLRPWFKNVTKSLRKEPKWYLTDWSGIADVGRRAETFVACHLLKAVQNWEDAGFGRFELRYLRDKQQREVDFCVVRDGKPWFLVEVKAAGTSLSPALAHFQAQTGAKHAFQVVVDQPFVSADPFQRTDPCVVPAVTLLSMLP